MRNLPEFNFPAFHAAAAMLRAAGNSGAPSVLVAYGQDDADRLAVSSIPGRFVSL